MLRITDDDVQHHVAARLRLRCNERSVSREDLAAHLGVGYQQIRKYQMGVSRISAPTLFRIAAYLDTDIAWFFDGLPRSGSTESGASDSAYPERLHALLSSPDGLRLIDAFCALPSGVSRRKLLELAEALATEEADRTTAAAVAVLGAKAPRTPRRSRR